MKIIENKTFDEERALYGERDVKLLGCRFDGEADGESALKESKNIEAFGCYFNLRYPFWHDSRLKIKDCKMTELCRAALWYSSDIEIESSHLHGIKALRECARVSITDTDINSTEFGWSTDGVAMKNSTARGEYFMLRSSKLNFENVKFDGKYSFQYITDSVFEHCTFNTKDAFWHAKDVVIRNSYVKGEYLAWYSENLTFENCKIVGTQPLCYCKGLKLIGCEMIDADLSFEKSEVEATLTSPIISIKNAASGYISVPSANEVICDDIASKCKILFT